MMSSRSVTSNSTGMKVTLDNTNMYTAKSDNGICVLCTSPASLVCGRCGDFYCSSGCRRSDWRTHRDVCVAMPLLLTKAEFIASAGTENVPQMCTAPKFVEQQQQHSDNDPKMPTERSKGNAPDRNNNQKPQIPERERPLPPAPVDLPRENKTPRGGIQQPVDAPQSNQIEIPHLSRVVITALHSSNRIFVRRVDEDYDEAYKNVLHTVDKYAQSCRPLAKVPAVGDEVVCRHDGIMQRCTVSNNKNAQNIVLELIDMGTRIYRTLGELRECTGEIAKLPRHVLMVHLHNVPVHRKTSEAYREFFRRLDGEYVILFKEKKSFHGAFTILKCPKTQESVNSVLEEFLKKDVSDDTDCSEASFKLRPHAQGNQPPRAKAPSSNESVEEKRRENEHRGHQAAPQEETAVKKAPFASANDREDRRPAAKMYQEESAKQPQQDKACEVAYKKPFETKLLPRDSTHLEVKIMDDSALDVGHFACALPEHLGTLHTVFQRAQELNLEREAPYAPKLNEYVMAKFEDEWYRALVLEMQDSTYLVNYVDFTNTAVITKEEIRRYPVELNRPCVTSLCVLHDFPGNIGKLKLVKLRSLLQTGNIVIIDRVLDYTDDNKVIVSCKLASEVYN